MNSGKRDGKWLFLFLGLLALAIIGNVLFKYPQPGVADQGDFTRVMCVSGLELKAENASDPTFVRFLDYTVTEYKIAEASGWELLRRVGATSMAYIITLINVLCRVFGQDTFKTGYLAIFYVVIYVFSIFVILKYLNIENKAKMAGFALAAFFILLDGNYLVWFNSLYGEPMMITTLMLYIAFWVYYIAHRYTGKSQDKVFTKLVFIFAAAILFLGSKIQVAYVLPVVLIMLTRLLAENKHLVKPYQAWLLSFLYVLTIVYPSALVVMDGPISRDRQYNSVFYGILKNSPTPEQDLMDMGLNPDMAVEAGKHSYLTETEYAKYVPRSQIAWDEFYSKMNNAKLVEFYISHPARFIQGMEYTASQAFITSTLLGKYDSKISEEPVREFNRFTLWSSFREAQLPKHLWFLVAVFAAFTAYTLRIYRSSSGSENIRAWIRLLWGVMFIGIVQFPMPFIGNGQADTAKQLYLFNFIFDLMLLVSICWCLHKVIELVEQRGWKLAGCHFLRFPITINRNCEDQ